MIPSVPALIAHPGFRTSAALRQAVSITTEEEKKTLRIICSCVQDWLVWPLEVHEASWNAQLPPGSGETPEPSLLPQPEMPSEDKTQPLPAPTKETKILSSVWTETRNSALRFRSAPSHQRLMPFSSISQLIVIHYPFAVHPPSPHLPKALIDLIALSGLTKNSTHTPPPQGAPSGAAFSVAVAPWRCLEHGTSMDRVDPARWLFCSLTVGVLRMEQSLEQPCPVFSLTPYPAGPHWLSRSPRPDPWLTLGLSCSYLPVCLGVVGQHDAGPGSVPAVTSSSSPPALLLFHLFLSTLLLIFNLFIFFSTSKQPFSCSLSFPPAEKIAQTSHYNVTVWKLRVTKKNKTKPQKEH